MSQFLNSEKKMQTGNDNYQEKREEEDLPASKTALPHPYNDSKTT